MPGGSAASVTGITGSGHFSQTQHSQFVLLLDSDLVRGLLEVRL